MTNNMLLYFVMVNNRNWGNLRTYYVGNSIQRPYRNQLITIFASKINAWKIIQLLFKSISRNTVLTLVSWVYNNIRIRINDIRSIILYCSDIIILFSVYWEIDLVACIFSCSNHFLDFKIVLKCLISFHNHNIYIMPTCNLFYMDLYIFYNTTTDILLSSIHFVKKPKLCFA